MVINQLLLAVDFMQKKNIKHQNLKPENVMFVSKNIDDFSVKITNLGFSSLCIMDQKYNHTFNRCLFMAPELVSNCNKNVSIKYNEKMDVWSIGIITHLLLTGKHPFPYENNQEFERMIADAHINYSLPHFK